MATASVTAIELSEKECSVCHELFTEPKLLPCGHLLCRHCLLSWLKSQKQTECPLCRYPIVEAEVRGNQSLEDIADGFPTDLAMKAVVDADRILSKGHSCCVCEDVAATSMCLNCGDMLCKTCTKAHRKMSLLKHHKVEDLSSLTAEQLAANCAETCAVHADRTSEVFCPTHGASICLLCATTDHRSCPEVTKLETKMEEARTKLVELAATLSAGETELSQAIGQLDQHLQETEKRTRAAIAEIETMCDRLESAVKACRRRLTELARSACSDVKEAVQERKTCLLKRRGKLTTHKRVVERVREIKTRTALKDMASVLITRVTSLDCSATLPPDAKVVSTKTLIIDPEAVSRVEQALSELGHVKTMPADILVQAPLFRFHSNHGSNIVLSNHQQTAEKQGHGNVDCIVVSSQPMEINYLYEIQLDRREDTPKTYMLPLGVVSGSPEHVELPSDVIGWKSAIVVCNSTVCVHGTQVPSELGQKLKDIPEGSRLGLSLDVKRNLLLYLNGACQETVTSCVAEPAHFCFDLEGPYKQVTALPVTPLK